MKIKTTLKLCKPNAAKHINISGSAEFGFTHAGAVAIDATNAIVLADANNPYKVYVEVTVDNDAYFVHVMSNEKQFETVHKFFDVYFDDVKKDIVDYICDMTIIDTECAYAIEGYNLTLPNAEEGCMSCEMKLNYPVITQEDLDAVDVAALYIRRNESTDILLKMYVNGLFVTESRNIYPKVVCCATTYDEEAERILPEDYRDVFDIIDSLIAMDGTTTCIYAVDAAACCGEDIDLNERCYPVQELTVYCNRHGKNYALKLKGE